MLCIFEMKSQNSKPAPGDNGEEFLSSGVWHGVLATPGNLRESEIFALPLRAVQTFQSRLSSRTGLHENRPALLSPGLKLRLAIVFVTDAKFGKHHSKECLSLKSF